MLHKAILCTAPGGPEKLKWQEVPIPTPGEGEVLIHQRAVGLNFIDIYHRTGLYPLPSFPAILGLEGSGVIEKIGPGVTGLKPGDPVAYCGGPVGAYTQYRTIAQRHLVKLPDGVTFELAAAMMLKGLTAHYLVRRTFMVNETHTVLVHAAAGGVGLLLCQWAKFQGARVIGSVGSEEEAALAKQFGCDDVILYKKEDIAARVRELTGGAGVHCVYDSVGQATFQASLDSLRPMGILVSYGQASGSIPPMDLSILQKKSLFLTRPTLFTYIAEYNDFILSCADLFEMVMRGNLKVKIGQSYYLSDAASAHRDLEAGKTTGASIMVTA